MSRKRNREELLEDIVQSTAANLFDQWNDGNLANNTQEDWEKQALVHLKSHRVEDIQHSAEGWCVTIVIACPDDKSPRSTLDIQYFRTEEKAKQFLKISKIEYLIDSRIITKEDGEKITDEEIEISMEKDFDDAYSDYFMDMPPFEGIIRKIRFSEDYD